MRDIDKRIQSRVFSINPASAQSILDGCKFDGQRHVKDGRLKMYAEEMRRGLWRPGSVIKTATVGRDRYLINGQHRLLAVVESGVAQDFVIVNVDCADLEAVRLLYAVEDDHSKRANGDIVLAMGLPEKTGVSMTILSASLAAIKFIASGFIHQPPDEMSTQDFLLLQSEYMDAIFTYSVVLAGIPRNVQNLMKRASVMSVALVTLRYSAGVYGEQRVLDFWEGIAADDGLSAGDPRKMALKHITESRMPTRAAQGTHKRISAAAQARAVANYFNGWIEGKTYKQQTRISDIAAPIKIAGSPWTGE